MRPINKRPDRTELERQVGRLKGLTYILAILLATSLIVLSIWVANPINDNQHQSDRQDIHQHNEGDKEHDLAESSRWLFDPEKPLVSTGDTIADWVSTAFTALAFGVLVWNLILTRKMISDTRDIGRKQSRAYLHMSLSKIEAKGITGSEDANIRLDGHFKIKNPGLTPAYDVRVLYDICETDKGAGVEIDVRKFQDAGVSASFLSSGESRNQKLSRVWRTEHLDLFKPAGKHCIRISYTISFMDEFGEARETPITSGTLHEFPNGNLAFLPDRIEYRAQ